MSVSIQLLDMKSINILAFDCGGTASLLAEVKLLKSIMSVVTLLLRKPKFFKSFYAWQPMFSNVNARNHLIAIMDNIEDQVHPTKVFDFIVGNVSV